MVYRNSGQAAAADGRNGFYSFMAAFVKLWIFPFHLIYDKDISRNSGSPCMLDRVLKD